MAGSALTRPAGTAGRSGRPFRPISKRLTSFGNCSRSTRGPNNPGHAAPAWRPIHAGRTLRGHRRDPEQAAGLGRVGRIERRLARPDPGELPARSSQGADISEVVIFPYSDNERRGIEDLRLVRFTGDDGSFHYYGTYTAYNGFQIFPHLLEYPVGQNVEIHMLTGRCAKNKGMALFPRKIRGRYAMVARLDNENLYYMESDDVRVWDGARLLLAPKFPWEVIQIGNCGSPLETEAGWLLLTHGVGPMRQYCIGATLLDLDDPCRVIGQTSEPCSFPPGASGSVMSRTSSTRAAE